MSDLAIYVVGFVAGAVLWGVVLHWRTAREQALEDPKAFLRRRMDRMSRQQTRRRFKKITGEQWPAGIAPAPPSPHGLDAHYERLANEVVPDTAIDGEDPK